MADAQRTRQADADLLELWVYTAENNIEAANSAIQSIGRRCYDCADLPGMGRRDDLAPGLRSITEGSYIIFYRLANDGIQIVRVVHGARDLPACLSEPSVSLVPLSEETKSSGIRDRVRCLDDEQMLACFDQRINQRKGQRLMSRKRWLIAGLAAVTLFSLILVAHALFVGTPRNPMTEKQADALVRHELPLGASVSQVKTWLDVRGIEHSEYGPHKSGGEILFMLRDTHRSFLISSDIQIKFAFDGQGRLMRRSVREVFTGP